MIEWYHYFYIFLDTYNHFDTIDHMSSRPIFDFFFRSGGYQVSSMQNNNNDTVIIVKYYVLEFVLLLVLVRITG